MGVGRPRLLEVCMGWFLGWFFLAKGPAPCVDYFNQYRFSISGGSNPLEAKSREPCMNLLGKGCFPLCKLGGVTVLIHWSWFLVAYLEISLRSDRYPAVGWNIAEYLALFGIVLLHEFGHALACRQVGGKAERVVLWPLGGIALVQPPPRPGALLWSIAAGPLVNLVLVPLTWCLCAWSAKPISRKRWRLLPVSA